MRVQPQPFSTLFPAAASVSQSELQEDNGEPCRTQRDWHLTYCTANINSLTWQQSDVVWGSGGRGNGEFTKYSLGKRF